MSAVIDKSVLRATTETAGLDIEALTRDDAIPSSLDRTKHVDERVAP